MSNVLFNQRDNVYRLFFPHVIRYENTGPQSQIRVLKQSSDCLDGTKPCLKTPIPERFPSRVWISDRLVLGVMERDRPRATDS